MQYLDPKVDLVFKRIFSQAELLKDFLNSVLPLDAPIESVTYLPTEQVPRIPVLRFSIVDVKCADQNGQIFVVEMQMLWNDAYFSRILFSASQAIVNQLSPSEEYKALCPVYSVTILNHSFDRDPEEKDRWLHHYKITRMGNQEKILKGLQFVILELPKFTPQTKTEKKVTALWLRFLRETGNSNHRAPDPELLSYQPVAAAMKLTECAGYSAAQISAYENYLDSVRNETGVLRTARSEGWEEGRAEGLEEGIEEGKLAVARNLLALLDDEAIAKVSDLPVAVIKKLRDKEEKDEPRSRLIKP